jgi:sulfide:quinone oxidoreductase
MASLAPADVAAFADVLKTAPTPIVAHCRSGTRSALLWALAQMHDVADPVSLVAAAARHGIDIAALPAIAARQR